MRAVPQPCSIVIFGATGDLTHRKLIPALYNLAADGDLPPAVAIIGFARREKNDEQFRAELEEAIRKFSRQAVRDEIWKTFAQSIFYHQSEFGDEAGYEAAAKRKGEALEADEAADLGLITFAPDDIDWDEEIRIATEERASFSPDALTGLEANYRFAGPETMETKIFGRLSAWQNWIFNRPNASGPDGALRRFGTGQRALFDRKRV